MERFLLFIFSCCLFNTLLAQTKRTPYDNVNPFVEDMALVTKEGKYGFINRAFQEVIPPVYMVAEEFSDGLAAVEVDDSVALQEGGPTWIFIDKTGRQVVPGRFEIVLSSFKEGIAEVWNAGKSHLINKEGQFLEMPAGWKLLLPFKHGLVKAVSEVGKYSVINLKGEIVIPGEYEIVNIISPALILVGKNNEYGFFSNRGKRLTKLEYDDYESLENGFVAIKKKKKWGLVNNKGKEILSPAFDEIGSFYEGMAQVEGGEKVGFVNEAGKIAVPVQYDQAGDFINGKASVRLDDKQLYVDKKGNLVNEDYVDFIATQIATKEAAEKMFLDCLNSLVKAYPYEGLHEARSMVTDSLFAIYNGVLVGSIKEYTIDGVVLQKITVPVARLSDVWYDYNMGLYVEDKAGTIQYTQPDSNELDKEYKTDMLHLASPGDGHHGLQWQGKLQVALKTLRRFYP